MGLLDYLQQDPNKQEALRQGLLNAGIAMMGSQSPNFLGSAAQGASSGMQAYTKQFEEQKRKIAQQQAMQAATKPSTPAVYGVGGNVGNADFAQMAAGQNRDINALSALPRMDKPYSIPQGNGVSTLPLKGVPAPVPQPIEQPVDEAALQMAVNQEQGAPEMPTGVLPEQIQQIQPAQAGGFDVRRYAEAVISDANSPESDRQFAFKLLLESEKANKTQEKPQLVEVYDDKAGRTVKQWMLPGQADGVKVGYGKPDADSYKERTISPDGKTYVKQSSNDGGKTWRQIEGTQPYDIRAASGSSSVSINNSPQLGPKYTEGVDKLGAQYLFEQFGEARNAATAVSAVKDAKLLLDQGMFTGRTGPWQESLAGWYQGITGRQMPKLDATQQFKTVIGDIVLPALANLKGASSDRDFKKIEEYSRGEATMTEGALKNHLDRLFNKYGAQVNNFNTTLDEYKNSGGGAIPGLRRLDLPSGNIKPPEPPKTPKDLPKKPPVRSKQDNEAVTWARANPNDPRSAKILRLNGQ